VRSFFGVSQHALLSYELLEEALAIPLDRLAIFTSGKWQKPGPGFGIARRENVILQCIDAEPEQLGTLGTLADFASDDHRTSGAPVSLDCKAARLPSFAKAVDRGCVVSAGIDEEEPHPGKFSTGVSKDAAEDESVDLIPDSA
jgi:hypothetical protein